MESHQKKTQLDTDKKESNVSQRNVYAETLDVPFFSSLRKAKIRETNSVASKQRTSPRLSTSSNSSTIQQSSKHAPSQTSQKRTPKKTVHEILSVPETTPLSKTEEKLHTRLLMRKRAISKDKDVIACRTGGQPHYFMKVIKSRKKNISNRWVTLKKI